MNPASFEDLVTTLDTGYRPQGLLLALLASLIIHTSVVLAFMQTQVLQPPQIPPISLDLLLLTDSKPAASPAEVQPSASAPAANPPEIPARRPTAWAGGARGVKRSCIVAGLRRHHYYPQQQWTRHPGSSSGESGETLAVYSGPTQWSSSGYDGAGAGDV